VKVNGTAVIKSKISIGWNFIPDISNADVSQSRDLDHLRIYNGVIYEYSK